MEDIQLLESERSSSTTLISMYLKGGQRARESACQKIAKELAAAENIKSESTRKEVLNNLKSIQRNLKELKMVPEKGLAIFSGNGHYI